MGNRHSAVDSSGKSCGQKYCPQLFPELPTASLPCRLPTSSTVPTEITKAPSPYLSCMLPAATINFVYCGRDSVGCPEVIFRLRPTSYYIADGCFGHWAFLSCFENFVPFQEENSVGIRSCGRANWAFLEEFLIFVPFCSCFATRNWQEKGTKIRKWQENAQMAEKKGRKTEVFLPFRGTNF